MRSFSVTSRINRALFPSIRHFETLLKDITSSLPKSLNEWPVLTSLEKDLSFLLTGKALSKEIKEKNKTKIYIGSGDRVPVKNKNILPKMRLEFILRTKLEAICYEPDHELEEGNRYWNNEKRYKGPTIRVFIQQKNSDTKLFKIRSYKKMNHQQRYVEDAFAAEGKKIG
ncbi:hypothetical protein NPIL_227251 [Nephila pilipes]|uniref:Uncharacterized protein n=1 Tax=Nephila pilipes TaxID=299642 RepID=A0A8X6MTU2_NEPPI|nr:hypothetical protein NPIL_227251 [Nephila pilipes]